MVRRVLRMLYNVLFLVRQPRLPVLLTALAVGALAVTGAAPSQQVADGEVLRAPGRDELWLVEGGMRRWIPDLDTFRFRGLSWEQVRDMPLERLRALPVGRPVGFVRVVRDTSTGAIYLVSAGQKSWVPDPETFAFLGLPWDEIENVDSVIVNTYSDAPPQRSIVTGALATPTPRATPTPVILATATPAGTPRPTDMDYLLYPGQRVCDQITLVGADWTAQHRYEFEGERVHPYLAVDSEQPYNGNPWVILPICVRAQAWASPGLYSFGFKVGIYRGDQDPEEGPKGPYYVKSFFKTVRIYRP